MKTRIQKWGNSLATRLPKSFAEELDLGDGAPIEMTIEDGAIVIRPDRDRVWDLETLLAGVTDENIHPAWETGPSIDPEETIEGEGRGGGEER
jgi:antitoxin MazE